MAGRPAVPAGPVERRAHRTRFTAIVIATARHGMGKGGKGLATVVIRAALVQRHDERQRLGVIIVRAARRHALAAGAPCERSAARARLLGGARAQRQEHYGKRRKATDATHGTLL